MSRHEPVQMDADTFLEWSVQQEGRFELRNGRIMTMAAERAAHARVKNAAVRALEDGIDAAGLPCEAFPDGMTVRVSDDTVYEPDASVRCGDPIGNGTVEMTDPVILIEVLSRSTTGYDLGPKLADYFTIPTVIHYLVLDPRAGLAIHHERQAEDAIITRILKDGALVLDPPGLSLSIDPLFARVRAAPND